MGGATYPAGGYLVALTCQLFLLGLDLLLEEAVLVLEHLDLLGVVVILELGDATVELALSGVAEFAGLAL